jgi:hypothetical protein
MGIFGRSSDLRQLDDALRAADLHPRLVPEAVKLTTVRLLAEAAGDAEPRPADYTAAALLLTYCMVGPDGFVAGNGEDALARVEARIERALDDEGSLDARLILLTLHAKVIQPVVVDTFGLHTA